MRSYVASLLESRDQLKHQFGLTQFEEDDWFWPKSMRNHNKPNMRVSPRPRRTKEKKRRAEEI